MKVFVKVVGILMIIIIITSFSKMDGKKQSIEFLEQQNMLTIDNNLKYEMAIENLSLLNNQKILELNTKDQEMQSETVTSQPILSKRKSKSYKSEYRGSFYRAYDIN